MDWDSALRLANKTDFLMSCQERTGVAFDKPKAQKLYEFCCIEMKKIEAIVEPQLPLRALNKGELKKVTPPKIQFKNSKKGLIPSAHAERFFDRIEFINGGYIGTLSINGGETKAFLPFHEPMVTEGPMRLKHQAALKNWLLSLGWSPTLWNFQKDSNGKFVRPHGKLIKTSPKFHDKGTICPNLKRLSGKVELVTPIIRWLSLRNRRSVVYNPEKGTGWLSNPRLEKDGRLPAGASGLTYTMRQKHKVIANLPRVSSMLGKEMRELVCAAPGKVLVGWDAASLEAFVKGHYAYNYEGGIEYYERITHPDFDEHQATADAWGLDNRQDAKPGNYGLQYNQQPSGLAATYNVSLAEGERRHAAYWEINKPWKLCLDKLAQHWAANGRKGIHCSTTGYFLNSRSLHSLGSLLVQHTGAIVMDYAGAIVDQKLGGIKYDSFNLPVYIYKGEEIRRVIYYHDEYIFECSPEIAEELLVIGIKSIASAGRGLNLNVPLHADGAIGLNWSEIH